MCLPPRLHLAASPVGLLCAACRREASSSHWPRRSRSPNEEPSLALRSKQGQNSQVSREYWACKPKQCTKRYTKAGAPKSEKSQTGRKTHPRPCPGRRGGALDAEAPWSGRSITCGLRKLVAIHCPSWEPCDLKQQGSPHLRPRLAHRSQITPVPQSTE